MVMGGDSPLDAVVYVLLDAVKVEGRRQRKEGKEGQQPRVSQHVWRWWSGLRCVVCGGVLQQRERADVVEVPSGSFVGGDAFREKRFRAGLKGVSMWKSPSDSESVGVSKKSRIVNR
jgi:hypothetical protein